ncbi:MAG TPA: hypothetical protein VLS93_19360 [Anaeromyxobacteraceae bacterium]|nr:hypothetical protein [Anaeromyxobacteraceae bacterium]
MTIPGAGAGPLAIDAFACAKAGNRREEYEDAWAVRGGDSPRMARVAVTDGATEASFSALWATLLAESWVRSRVTGPDFAGRLGAARRLWSRMIRNRPLPWYAAEKARRGAYAAFLGLSLLPRTGAWRALAIGDCNLFQLEGLGPGLRLVRAFPLDRADQFGSSPFLVGSVARTDDVPDVRLAEGVLPGNGLLLLASDALSAWLLRREERGRPAWEAVSPLGVGDAAEFEELVAWAREDGARNDDMTLVRIVPRP